MRLDSEFSLPEDRASAGDERRGLDSTISVSPGEVALASMMQQLINDLPEQIALLDNQLRILAVNQAWSRACVGQGYLNVGVGDSYGEVCAARAAEGYEPAALAIEALRDMAAGRRQSWQLMYNGSDVWSGRDYRFSAHRIRVGNHSFISVARADVTELVQLRRLRSDFADSVLREQADERRRLGRELHDSTSQLLASVNLLLGRLKRETRTKQCTGIVDELQGLLSEAQQEIRSISLLTNPPLLDHMSLTDALTLLIRGIGRRTNIKATFEVRGEPLPLSTGTEAAIYRVAQEALSNIQRHAHAKRARVCLWFRKSAAHLVVSDDGCGISATTLDGRHLAGVGLAGMRSRLAELGGRLTIRGLDPGTAIIASCGLAGALPSSANSAPHLERGSALILGRLA